MIDFSKINEMDFTSVEIYSPNRVDGTFIAHFRNKHKLSQQALANIIGVSYKTILRWEQRKNPIKGSAAVLLSLLNDNDDLVDNVYRVKHNKGLEQIEEECVYTPTGVAKLKLSLSSEMIVKSENANAECKAKPIDEVTCRATVSVDELKDTSRVLYLVSRLYQNMISEVAVKGMYGAEDKTNEI